MRREMKFAGGIVLLLLLTGLFWLATKKTAPQPGISVPALSRDHVSDDTPVEYNSNPPTSGPHNADWERAGIYDNPLNDRKLVHSLEHGYVIISYNCDFTKTSSFNCQNLVSALKSTAQKQKIRKLIVVPRPNLDNRIALTAWTKIDKFYDFDEKRIAEFIKAYRDRGPERTMD